MKANLTLLSLCLAMTACVHNEETNLGGAFYVAACGDIATTGYKFKCDAGDYTGGYLYDQNWNEVNWYTKNWRGEWVSQGNGYKKCGDTHTFPAEGIDDSVLFLGFYDEDKNHKNGNEFQVYIWCDNTSNKKDIHATTQIKDITSQINRS